MGAQENLARKFKPAGFEQPEGDRHEYGKPSPELQKAFCQWIEEACPIVGDMFVCHGDFEEKYQKAMELTKGIEATPEEANSLLIQDYGIDRRQIEMAGLFVSVFYNRSGRKYLVFDLDAGNVDYLGYQFGGVLINRGRVGRDFGQSSTGTVINDGEAGWYLGEHSQRVINNGFADYACGWSAKEFVVNNDEAFSGLGKFSKGPVLNNNKTGKEFGRWCESFAVNNGDLTGGDHFVSGVAVLIKEPIYDVFLSTGCFSVAKRVLYPRDCARIPELKKYIDSIAEKTRKLKGAKPEEIEEVLNSLSKESIENGIKGFIEKI